MGYDREYRMRYGMWSKSSRRFADRMERNVLKLGFGLGAALLSGGSKSSRSRHSHHVSSAPSFVLPTTPPSLGLSAKSARVTCIILLILAPVLQALGYVSYEYWGFWTFFSLLLFSTPALFCIGFSFTIADDTTELGEKGRKVFFIATIIVAFLTLCLSFWPIIVKDSERTSLSYILLALEDLLLIALSFSLCYESSVFSKKENDIVASVPTIEQPSKPKKTFRRARIMEMEARYDRVKAAFDDLKKAEEELGDLSEDIEALRDYVDSGDWQVDYEADEEGRLPKDLKRGVLSEDGLWNLLEEVEDRV